MTAHCSYSGQGKSSVLAGGKLILQKNLAIWLGGGGHRTAHGILTSGPSCPWFNSCYSPPPQKKKLVEILMLVRLIDRAAAYDKLDNRGLIKLTELGLASGKLVRQKGTWLRFHSGND